MRKKICDAQTQRKEHILKIQMTVLHGVAYLIT